MQSWSEYGLCASPIPAAQARWLITNEHLSLIHSCFHSLVLAAALLGGFWVGSPLAGRDRGGCLRALVFHGLRLQLLVRRSLLW